MRGSIRAHDLLKKIVFSYVYDIIILLFYWVIAILRHRLGKKGL